MSQWARPIERRSVGARPGAPARGAVTSARVGGTPEPPAHPLLALQRRLGNQAVLRLLASARSAAPAPALPAPLQRALAVIPGKELPNRHIGEGFKKGSAQLGYTYPMLNGQRVHSTGAIFQALKQPTITVTEVGKSRFRATIAAIGDNVASWEIEYVDPKQTNEPIALTKQEMADAVEKIKQRWPGLVVVDAEALKALRQDPTGAASVVIQADFAQLAKETLHHERHHAQDHEKVFKTILGGWDQKLTLGQKQFPEGVVVGANDAEAAEEKLWPGVGGDPFEVAERVWTKMVERSDAFHSTHEGREAEVSKVLWSPQAARLEFWFATDEKGHGPALTTIEEIFH